MQKSNQPLLSICIPTLDRIDILRETLEHLAATLDPSFEIVVSNNCPSDRMVDMLEDFKNGWSRFRYITNTRKLHIMENWKAAIRMARGQYLYGFCDDDRIIVESLNKAIDLMRKQPEIVGVFGGHHEWNPEKGKIVGTQKKVDDVTVFPKGAKMEVLQKFKRLVHPVIRTDICHRFCVGVFNKHSWGAWPFVGKMLDHGAIAVVPDIFFMHVHTEGRVEYSLTEGWYHDMYRADFELYAGEIGPGDNAKAIGMIAAQAYLHSVRFALLKQELLTAWHYVLRARAYGLVTDKYIVDFQQGQLTSVVAEYLKELVSLVPGVRRIIIESHPISEKLRPALVKILPEMDICQVSREDILNRFTKPEEFILAWEHQTLQERSAQLEEDPFCQYSLKDAFDNCRILSGPTGNQP